MKTDNFNKFFNKKNNAAVKESIRQEKKTAKKERKAAIERHFEERRKGRTQQSAPPNARPSAHAPRGGAPTHIKPARGTAAPGRPTSNKFAPGKPGKPSIEITAKKTAAPTKPNPVTPGKPNPAISKKPAPVVPSPSPDTLPLNKYIAHGGICSRRDAADLVRHGKVTVNGKPVTEPGTKVQPTDLVKVNNKKVTISSNFVYILLNKPKDIITTAEDPQGRRTVLDLIRPATTERVYPVGRLDRNTSGVLLLTNDGDLAQKLAHPKHQIRKIYHVTLDKPLTKADFEKIASGAITLDDGPAPVDDLAYPDPKDKTQIGLEIHSGRNRIVRRIFEHLGYDVRGLDRVMYAGLTKKNVQRGHWRLLTDKEIRILKYLNSSMKGSPGHAKDLDRARDLEAAQILAPEKGAAHTPTGRAPAAPTAPRPAHQAAPPPRAASPHRRPVSQQRHSAAPNPHRRTAAKRPIGKSNKAPKA